jgi:putative membrane protein
MTQNLAPVPAKPVPAKYATSPNVDRIFALAATQANNAELDLAHLALKQGSANEVQGYAGKMIAEHEGLMKEMQPAIGRLLGSGSAEQRLAPSATLAMQHLQSVPAVSFDQEYILGQIGSHLVSMMAFQTEADNGTDPELKALAQKWLPSIKAHLELAVDLTQHIGGASPFKSH